MQLVAIYMVPCNYTCTSDFNFVINVSSNGFYFIKVNTVDREIFVRKNIHGLRFHVNKFLWMIGSYPQKYFTTRFCHWNYKWIYVIEITVFMYTARINISLRDPTSLGARSYVHVVLVLASVITGKGTACIPDQHKIIKISYTKINLGLIKWVSTHDLKQFTVLKFMTLYGRI